MAITNAQQARQLYNKGGPMRKIKGQDHMLAYITPNERDTLVEDVNHLKRWKSMYIKIFWTLFTGAVGVATFLIGESIINR